MCIGKKKERGKHYTTNRLAKKRRAERSLPKTKKSVKNQIRDLRRQLMRVKKQKGESSKLEHELHTLVEQEATAATARKKEEKAIARARRYHKVKFFERRKVERRLKQVRRELEAEPSSKLKKEEAGLLDDLDYIKFFPKDSKYISLFFDDPTDKKTTRRRIKFRDIALKSAAEARARGDAELSDSEDDEDPIENESIAPVLVGKEMAAATDISSSSDDFFCIPSAL